MSPRRRLGGSAAASGANGVVTAAPPDDGALVCVMIAACPFPARRGTPVRIQRLAEALAARGHEIHVVTYHHGAGEVEGPVRMHRIRPPIASRDFTPGPTYYKLGVLDPLLAWLARRVLCERPAHIIHAHHAEGLITGALARAGTGIPLVYDAHTLIEWELPYYPLGLPAGLKRAVGRAVDRALPKWCDHVITVTETIRKGILERRLAPAERVSVVTTGVELDVFGAVPGPAPDQPPTLVFAGNLAVYQGVEQLLRAMRPILDRRPDVRLRIVTESAFEPYEPLARALGVREAIDVMKVGFEGVPALIGSAHVALNPRVTSAGTPVKLLNYMAAGRPIVSFEGSAPDLVHGREAWLVAGDDPAAFAEAVLALLANPSRAAALGANGRRHVERYHSWAMAAEQTERIYRRILSGARAVAS